MSLRIRILVLMILGSFAFAKAQLSTFSTATKELLNNQVANGNVNYAAIKKNPQNLDLALKSLEKIELDQLTNNESKALLINAYNLFVIKGVVDHYPIKSVMDKDNFFDEKVYTLGSQKVSLNQLEKEILLKRFPDERLHFALVCGAVSCPPLSMKPYTAENVEFMLKKTTKAAINNPNLVKLDMHEKKVYASKIFDWYNADFTKNQTLIEYLNRYREDMIPDGFVVQFMNYDWALNGK
ncbi:hypothetical protein AAU57_04800 [Nonlabens sp. YIK11]|uniref:DUF547 domain-containing protein n=1 Tax=Nonlabens sp. YIK11 TaxID=1453349 RepID=UPI00070793F8|nr:DUF547 domain-containing protein [Nonlabens sp. YIK11]KQC34516.1 hypothetical protein AAU57_04800 [Nonlabens sp. YIK11]